MLLLRWRCRRPAVPPRQRHPSLAACLPGCPPATLTHPPTHLVLCLVEHHAVGLLAQVGQPETLLWVDERDRTGWDGCGCGWAAREGAPEERSQPGAREHSPAHAHNLVPSLPVIKLGLYPQNHRSHLHFAVALAAAPLLALACVRRGQHLGGLCRRRLLKQTAMAAVSNSRGPLGHKRRSATGTAGAQARRTGPLAQQRRSAVALHPAAPPPWLLHRLPGRAPPLQVCLESVAATGLSRRSTWVPPIPRPATNPIAAATGTQRYGTHLPLFDLLQHVVLHAASCRAAGVLRGR